MSTVVANPLVPLSIPLDRVKDKVLVLGSGNELAETIDLLLKEDSVSSVIVIVNDENRTVIRKLLSTGIWVREKEFDQTDLVDMDYVIVSGNGLNAAISIKGNNGIVFKQVKHLLNTESFANGNEEQKWKGIASKLIIAFALMVIGHIIISYLPLPPLSTIITNLKPYFNEQFALFVLTGFLAQLVDGTLSMGYGVTSATCLMSFGISPVSVSAAIHTSEVFTTGISGYSHYKFGNVNKKLFRHLVIPGVIGAILGALMLVFLGEKAGKWLLPIMAFYAMFLGFKILIKAFSINSKSQKVKRVGWLAWIGGFLDSFGGGGWGPIVTSTLISKGRSPKYTIGSVSLAEFFITIASAATFFITAGISHWNVVLGLLIGGAVAAPLAARLAGKLPRKTMMIAVGIMVIIWCLRMLMKSVGLF